jgi:hypothetical protein
VRILYTAVLLALWSCESKPTNSIDQETGTGRTAALPTTAADPHLSTAAVLGDYDGALGGKYPFRLSITSWAPDSQLVGMYYYLSQHKPIGLVGRVEADGEVWLRELNPESPDSSSTWADRSQPRHPLAYFRLRPSGVGALAGTWQKANSGRQLPAQLTRYQQQGVVQKAHVGEQRYFDEFTMPVFTVPSPGVTRELWDVFDLQEISQQTLDELREAHAEHQRDDMAQGFAGMETDVTYNDRGLLSVSLRSEYTAANVSHNFQTVVVDLRTGQVLDQEINLAREKPFLAACERKLQAQLTQYLAEEYGAATPDEDVADELNGLRQQHIDSNNGVGEMRLEPDGVSFHYDVNYESMSNLMFKQFQNQFWLKFSFAELAPLLKPDSPLQRLVRP